jgi:transglutaminase-like putative cysteine protease
MNRRHFLQATVALAAPLTAQPSATRTFDIKTSVEILKPARTTRIWLPVPLAAAPFQKTLAREIHAPGGRASLTAGIATAEFAAGARPVVTLTARVQTTAYSGSATRPSPAELAHFLQPTRLIPTNGIVKEKADEITRGAATPQAKARAIYEWIVDNTFRNPKTRGCGVGDIRFMLESGDLGGKCADLNALYVGLARAAGLPARDAYGIRVGPSRLGYKSLGTASETITKAQHCRAEVYIEKQGWLPVDPADVRKVVLEEPPGNRSLDDAMVKITRARLFGSWEMNWVAWNFAADIALPGSAGAPVPFLMYPQAETAEGRLDPLDPDSFRYEITAHEA